jgi:UDP-N-acetylglucosamine:LPS N-acetylglucosamine transferase
LSTGAALAVPFFVVGRLLGVRLVYVESFTRVQRPALAGRMVYPFADAFFVQWPTSSRRKRAIYAGSVV